MGAAPEASSHREERELRGVTADRAPLRDAVVQPCRRAREAGVRRIGPRATRVRLLRIAADTPPADGPIQGSLLLFKLDLASYQNRPLELHLKSPQNSSEVATISLDL